MCSGYLVIFLKRQLNYHLKFCQNSSFSSERNVCQIDNCIAANSLAITAERYVTCLHITAARYQRNVTEDSSFQWTFSRAFFFLKFSAPYTVKTPLLLQRYGIAARLFADDVNVYLEMTGHEDVVHLQT